MEIEALVRGLKAGNEEDITTLKRMGKKAIVPLCNYFVIASPALQSYTLEALVMVADVSCTDFFLKNLKSHDPQVRSWSAQGLLKINHPEAISALVKTIADYPDEGHAQFTQSTYSLIGLGFKVLPALLPLLRDANPFIREIAWVAFSNIIVRTPEHENKWKVLWEAFGKYDPNHEPDHNNSSVTQWERWVNENLKT